MLKSILIHGVIAGLIVGGWLFGGTLMMNGHYTPNPYGMIIGYLSMLVALSAIFIAVKRHRDTQGGGVIRFWPALGLGLGITLVAGVLYVVAWELALAITGMDFAGDYGRALVTEAKAKGVSAEDLTKLTAQMEQFRTEYSNPVYRTLMTFAEIAPVGILVSLVSAGLLRNPRFMPARTT